MFPDVSQLYPEENSVELPPAQPAYAGAGPPNVFVLSIGGSVIANGRPDAGKIAELCSCINELVREGYKFVLVVGGGKPGREYIAAAAELGANHFVQDEIGISITRANAALFIGPIENSSSHVLTHIRDAKQPLDQGRTPVFGGLLPGLTTDAVGALIAEFLGGTFVNLSNVDGIYDSDPKTNSDALLYRELSHAKLLRLVGEKISKPGQNLIVDSVAAMVLRRSKIRALFLNGNDTQNLKAAIRGQEFTGTIVGDFAAGAESEEGAETPHHGRKKRAAKKPPKGKFIEWEEDPKDIDPEDIEM